MLERDDIREENDDNMIMLRKLMSPLRAIGTYLVARWRAPVISLHYREPAIQFMTVAGRVPRTERG